MILYMVRHGQSIANAQKRVTGTPDDVLSDIGVSQVQNLAAWLGPVKGACYVTSQWKRAQQTAQLLCPTADWQIDPRVGETFAGDVAEWTSEKFIAAYPGFFDCNDTRFPNGESHKDLYERVANWLDDTRAATSQNEAVVLVTHAGPISCLIQYALGLGWDRFPAFMPANASLSVMTLLQNKKPQLTGFSLSPQVFL